MKEFFAYNDRAMRPSTRIAAVIAGVVLIGLGITVPSIHSIFVGAVIMLAMAFSKYVVFTEEGLVTKYTFLSAPFYKEVWKYSDITDFHKERANDSNLTILHVGKDVLAKKLVFYTKDMEEIMELAHEKNSKIHFGDDVR